MKKLSKLIVSLLSFFIASPGFSGEIYDFSFDDIDGNPLPLSQYEGHVVMIVNTASSCGFTPQYAELEELYQMYKDRGLVIIAVPSNEFNQELESNHDIKEFVTDRYGVTFPLAGLTDIKGDSAHPFYLWAAENASFWGKPKWNFHKYIFDKRGEYVGSFSAMTKPLSTKIVGTLETLLSES